MSALKALPTGRRSLTQFASLFVVLLTTFASGTAALRADEPTLRLRIAWGGGTERTWQGTIAVDAGRLSDPQPLGLEADEPGSMWINDAGAVVVRQRSPRAYDGVDVAVHAELRGRLLISLSADGDAPGEPIAVDLSKLVDDTHDGSLDARKNRLLVRRVPGDKLRVTVVNPSLVFSPGERLMLRVQPHLLGPDAAGSIVVRSQVITARGKREISNNQQQLDLPQNGPDITIPLEMPVPAEPGAYDLVLTAAKAAPNDRLSALAAGGRDLLPKFAQRSDALAERRVQFVVVRAAHAKGDKPGPAPDAELMVINPAKTWWDRVAHLPKIPGMGHDPLEHGRVERWEHPQLGAMVTLGIATPADPAAAAPAAAAAAGAKGAEPAEPDEAWVAYPLSVSQPGQVHILEVEYPSDVPQAMTLSIVEPNAAGVVIPVGLDSGVYVPPEAEGTTPRLERHRLVFWPKTREPLLLISRGEGSSRAVHGQIRLLGPRRFGVAGLRLGLDARSELPRVAVPADSRRGTGRLVAGLLERPLFPENFGATDALDAWSGRSLDDWTTFHDGGRRMLEYAHYVGYNALIVGVLSDGSAIYPSGCLAPTPRYDTGAFFSTGQDPVRKDVLEMLLRMADEEGDTIIPLLQFTAPLPALEAQLRLGGQDAAGLELVGSAGITWTSKHGNDRGAAAYYNPLDPRVQQAMRQVVRELAERYGQHRSFGGVALGSSGNSYTLLPGPDWGLDDLTIARFSAETRCVVPGEGPQRFAQRARSLAAENREAWLNWRAEVLHRFHADLLKDIATAHAGAKLVVSTSGMLQSPEVEALLRPALPSRFKLDDLPLAVGLNCALYRSEPQIALLRPRLIAAPQTRASAAVERQANDSPELDRAFASSGLAGNLFIHTPLRARLSTFDSRSPFGADRTYTALTAQLTPCPTDSRRRFVEALALLDTPLVVDGGWMLSLGQEDALRPLIAAYRQLPDRPFQRLSTDTDGIVVRTLGTEGGQLLYVLNPTPWHCQVGLTVHGGETAEALELSGPRKFATTPNGRLTLDLEPYDLLALRVAVPGKPVPGTPAAELTFSDCTETFDPGVRDVLYQRIRDLTTRAAAVGKSNPIAVLKNSNFEQPSAGGNNVPGWVLAGGNGGEAIADAQQHHNGALSARLSSSGSVASLISNTFDAPSSGRVSFSVWVRTPDDAAPPPTLRLAIGGKLDGRDYYRFAEAPVKGQWEQFIFQGDNLPLSGLSDMQVRFDLMGAGTVWIDDVQVLNLTFNSNELTELSRIITRAQYALEAGKLLECHRVLSGYWPRYLEEHVPLPTASVAANPPPAADPHPEPQPEPDNAQQPWWRRGLPSIFK